MLCKCAARTNQYHGWACEITDGACAFLLPDSKLCAAKYGEGPDAENIEQDGEIIKKSGGAG